MKREMKLIGMILAYVEKSRNIGDIPPPEFDDYRKCEVETTSNYVKKLGICILRRLLPE